MRTLWLFTFHAKLMALPSREKPIAFTLHEELPTGKNVARNQWPLTFNKTPAASTFHEGPASMGNVARDPRSLVFVMRNRLRSLFTRDLWQEEIAQGTYGYPEEPILSHFPIFGRHIAFHLSRRRRGLRPPQGTYRKRTRREEPIASHFSRGAYGKRKRREKNLWLYTFRENSENFTFRFHPIALVFHEEPTFGPSLPTRSLWTAKTWRKANGALLFPRDLITSLVVNRLRFPPLAGTFCRREYHKEYTACY